MRFKVYLLRQRGRRLPWQTVVNGPPGHVGDLVTHDVDVAETRYTVATLRPLHPVSPLPIPELFEPVLLGFAPLAFRLRGFERIESPQGGFSVVQAWHCEWHCEVP